MEEIFAKAPFGPGDPGVEQTEAGLVETLHYRVSPRPKSKFKTLLNARELFGGGHAETSVTTTVAADGTSQVLDVRHTLGTEELRETLELSMQGGRVRAQTLRRQQGTAADPSREELVRFQQGAVKLPTTTYPEVTLPFVMRGQPRDGKTRAAWSYTNDRFVARVYYEMRKTVRIDVPAGRFEAALVWMYPDLNDWIALGNVVTRLVKPLIPRYDIWFETRKPYRVLRFEGPYGPPGAPEIVLELAR